MKFLLIGASIAVMTAAAGVAMAQDQTQSVPQSAVQAQQTYQDQQQQYQNAQVQYQDSQAHYQDQRAQYEAKRMSYAHMHHEYERAMADYDATHGHGSFVTYYSVHPGEYDRMYGAGSYERDFGRPVFYEYRP